MRKKLKIKFDNEIIIYKKTKIIDKIVEIINQYFKI